MKKLIIVEDEESLQRVMYEWLCSEGFDVKCATAGDEGLDLIKTENPDLVLLDLILPGLSGYEVLQNIKDDSQTKQIPVIIMSNLGDEDGRRRVLQMGASAYLVKADHGLDQIKQLIEKVLKENT